MSAKNIGYRRLVRRRSAGAAQTQGLWLADGHLLLATLVGMHEEYRRVFFEDIQAVLWHATKRRRNIDIVLVLLAVPLLVALVAAGVYASTVGVAIFGALLGLVVLAAFVNAGKGPSCALYIQTATGTAHLACVTRLRRAQRLVREIGSQATLRQGEMAPEAWDAAPVTMVPAAPPVPRFVPPPLATPVVTEPMIRVHRLAFALVLLGALPSLAMILTNNVALVLLKTLLAFGALLGCVSGLVRARRLPFGGRLAVVYAGALVYLVLLGMAAYVGLVILSMQAGAAKHTGAEWTALLAFASHCGMDSVPMLIGCAVAATVEVALGCVGFGMLNELRGQWAALAAATVAPSAVPPPAPVAPPMPVAPPSAPAVSPPPPPPPGSPA